MPGFSLITYHRHLDLCLPSRKGPGPFLLHSVVRLMGLESRMVSRTESQGAGQDLTVSRDRDVRRAWALGSGPEGPSILQLLPPPVAISGDHLADSGLPPSQGLG